MHLYIFSNVVGSIKSSPSNGKIKSDCAFLIPLFRAVTTPEFFWFIICMRLSRAAYCSKILALLSELPSFTHMTSISVKVCFNTESKHSDKYFSVLYTGIITLIFGMIYYLHFNLNIGIKSNSNTQLFSIFNIGIIPNKRSLKNVTFACGHFFNAL